MRPSSAIRWIAAERVRDLGGRARHPQVAAGHLGALEQELDPVELDHQVSCCRSALAVSLSMELLLVCSLISIAEDQHDADPDADAESGPDVYPRETTQTTHPCIAHKWAECPVLGHVW